MNVNFTSVTAIIGAGLGIWNLLQGFWQRRVRLKVIPKIAAPLSQLNLIGYQTSEREFLPDGYACIEVVNISSFPVTIAQVGYSALGSDSKIFMVPYPKNLLPKRLEAREAIDIRFIACPIPQNAKLAYAITQCGHTRYGDSIVLKKHRRIAALQKPE